MARNDTQLTDRLRDKLFARAMGDAPLWPAALLPAAELSAGSLLIGTLLEKLPPEDQSALVAGILAEQNADGSWSRHAGAAGDLSLTLEVVQALSTAGAAESRSALARAVPWLEENRRRGTLREDTLILLGALTEFAPRGWRKAALLLARLLPVLRIRALPEARGETGTAAALRVLGADKTRAARHANDLLPRQLPDGSWDGSARATVLALAALRYAGLPLTDAAFERGWRFLRALQHWHGEQLVQASGDLSNVYHAAAARALLCAGVEPELAGASCLTLLHAARVHGGWASGGLRLADTLSTALALDALSFFGDDPAETGWARRRAVHYLLRAQNPDGGWPLIPLRMSLLSFRGKADAVQSRIDATACAVQAIAYAGHADDAVETAIQRGLRFLQRRQRRDGFWEGDRGGSPVIATAWALEALLVPAAEHTAGGALRAVAGLLRRQSPDGGWSAGANAAETILETACVLRALNGMPGIPATALQSARGFLETRLTGGDDTVHDGPYVLPWTSGAVHAPDLAEIWALDALAPAPAHPPRRRSGRADRRSVSGRRFER